MLRARPSGRWGCFAGLLAGFSRKVVPPWFPQSFGPVRRCASCARSPGGARCVCWCCSPGSSSSASCAGSGRGRLRAAMRWTRCGEWRSLWWSLRYVPNGMRRGLWWSPRYIPNRMWRDQWWSLRYVPYGMSLTRRRGVCARRRPRRCPRRGGRCPRGARRSRSRVGCCPSVRARCPSPGVWWLSRGGCCPTRGGWCRRPRAWWPSRSGCCPGRCGRGPEAVPGAVVTVVVAGSGQQGPGIPALTTATGSAAPSVRATTAMAVLAAGTAVTWTGAMRRTGRASTPRTPMAVGPRCSAMPTATVVATRRGTVAVPRSASTGPVGRRRLRCPGGPVVARAVSRRVTGVRSGTPIRVPSAPVAVVGSGSWPDPG